MTVIVLGWDGLDAELAREFGVADAFGESLTSIDTICNDAIGKPHTFELWPSLITGLSPDEHGIDAATQAETGWANPLVALAARLSAPLPDSLRRRVGRWVRSAGADYDFHEASYYSDRGLSTVFDDCRAYPLAIPNYRSAADERQDITLDRGSYLADFIRVETVDGRTQHTPRVAPAVLQRRLAGDVGEKLALALAAAPGHDLVWVWLAFLDTAGHVAPVLEDSRAWQRQAYETAAAWTETVRARSDAAVICVSDHGLQDGAHTTRAALAGPEAVTGDVHSILGVRDTVTGLLNDTADRERWRTADTEVSDVSDRLEDLGYL